MRFSFLYKMDAELDLSQMRNSQITNAQLILAISP